MTWRDRARKLRGCPFGEVSKVSKDPFVPFETAQDGHSETSQHRSGDRGARDDIGHGTALLTDFQAALVLGRLFICGNCAYFTAGTDPGGLGHCRQFSAATWPFVPFICGSFRMSPRPSAPAFLPDPTGARALASQLGVNPLAGTRRAS